MSFGTPRSGQRTSRRFEKLKDGSQAFRILPPLGEAAEQGIWSRFYRIHYGYKDSAGKLRPFQSSYVKNNKTKMVEVPDAALEFIEKLKAKMEQAKESGDTAMIARLTKLIGNGKELGQYNLDSNHYLNALDTAGNIVILKLRHKSMLALLAKRKEMMDAGEGDPCAIEGKYLVFSRSGIGLETTTQVSPLQETVKIDGKTLKSDVVHVADEALSRRCVREDGKGGYIYLEAADLLNLFAKPTADEISEIVRDGATAVDRILGSPRGAAGETTAAAAPAVAGEQMELDIPEGELSAEYAIAPVTQTTVAAAVKAAQNVVSNAAVAAKSAPAAASIADMSDEDFLNSLD